MPPPAARPEFSVPSSQVRVARLAGWSDLRGKLRGVLLILLTAFVFWLLFRQIDVRQVWSLLQTVPASVWILAFLLTLSFPVFSALRWQLTLRAIGHRVPFRRCFTIILGVSPISAIAPSKAGDLLKAISFRGEIGVLDVGGTVLTERALDVIVLALLSVIGGFVTGQIAVARAAAAIAAAGIVALLLLPSLVPSVRKPALRDKLERVIRLLRVFRTRPALAGGVLALTVINWLASVIQTDLLLDGVGAAVPFSLTLSVLPVAIFIGLIPITLGGMGTRDAALVALLVPAVTPPQALSVGLLYSFFGYWLPALMGLPFLSAAFPVPVNKQASRINPPDASPPKTPRACKICGRATVTRHEVEGVTYHYCGDCDFLQNSYWEDNRNARPDQREANAEALVRLWQPGDPAHEREKALEILGLMTSPIAWTSRRLHTLFKSFLSYDRWYRRRARKQLTSMLDFGCGHGATTMALREEGIACTGVDPFAPRETSVILRTGVPDPRLRPGTFDGICAIEVMEHVTDVVPTFRELAGLLRPGGILLVQTHRLEDPAYRAQDADWFYLQEPTMHVAIYSKRAFRRIAERAGFRAVQFRGAKFARFIK